MNIVWKMGTTPGSDDIGKITFSNGISNRFTYDITSDTTIYIQDSDLLPTVIEGGEVVPSFDIDLLGKKEQETFKTAQEDLDKITPDGMELKQLVYYLTDETLTDLVLVNPYDTEDIIIMQFVEGQWFELEIKVDSEQIATIGALSGPMAIFTR